MTQRNRPLRVLRGRSRSAIGPSARSQLTLKPSATAVALALVALGGVGVRNAAAGPTDGVVSAGNATILQSGAVTTINQTSSRAAIDWRTFGINANESVIFQQPSSSAVALNRVAAGAGRSEIYGSLQANGHVFLINPAGVLFARGATVDVAGLVASTLNITNNDFMAGRLVFSGGAGSGSVRNEADSRVKDGGYIRARDGGYVAFLGNQVSNTGTINAPNGTVALGAGESMVLDFHGDGLLSLKVNAAAAKARIDNTGEIHAEGGAVIMSARAKDALLDTVLNVDGIVTAKGLVERGGYIYLDGGNSGV
ncbi:MAG TPA: filamentous hemagglutinin N-terminal domain-containing protein, partial [Burkholderiales bacterium]|nr:filamentous hemagglutinin N-terminal domain-containing protein [Burkholderiales bacterium]